MSKPPLTTIVQAGVVPFGDAPPADAPAFRPPTEPGDLGRLAGYRVLKLLGRGGMGAVYLGVDEGLRRQVALKVMLPKYAADAAASERFRREARAAAAVRHDNVVTVYQVGEDCGVPFIAMEFLTGYPLDEYLKRKGRLTVPQALRVGAETAAGLAAAHKLGLMHRDIKPANLWLEAPQGRIKILDFGLAKPVAVGEETELTGAGVVMGTPAYMAPEQAKGEPVDSRADLFSLGVVLYQLCTGQRPFARTNAVASLIALTSEEPAPVRGLNPEVPEALAQVIHALLAKDPANRLPGAAEVAKQLRALERGEAPAELRELTALATAAPQVVYVPIHVTAYEPGADAFAHLGDDPTTPPAATDRAPAPPRLAPARARFPRWAVAVALFAVGVAAVGGYFALRKPTEVATDAPPEPGGKPTQPTRPPTPPHPTRAFAQWVFDNGGGVETPGGELKSLAGAPRGAIEITGVSFVASKYPLADADVERFRACPRLKRLQLHKTALTEAGFKALLALPFAGELEVLVFASPPVPPAVLGLLANCPNLRNLTITGVPLTGRLKEIAKLPALVNLSASDTGLTDADLADLKDTRLTGLVINANPLVTADGLEHLVGLNLTELNIGSTGVTGRGAATVARLPKLVSLTANDLGWTDDDVAHLSARTDLNTLYLNGNPVTDRAVETFRALPKLQALILGGTKITDKGLARLHDNKALTQLYVGGAPVTLAGVKAASAALPNCAVEFDYDPKADPDRLLAEWLISKGGALSVLGSSSRFERASDLPAGPLRAATVYLPLNGYAITDDDVDRFRDTSVTWYALAGPHKVTDAGLERWSTFLGADKVKCFELNNRTVTHEGYAHLAQFKSLEALHLMNSGITDRGLAVCPDLPNLTTLGLDHTPVTDAGMKHLTGSKLQYVQLMQTAVGDAGAESLAAVSTLVRLELRGTKLTDKGLALLAACKNLKKLDVTRTGVTAAGAKAFRAALPTCELVSDHPP